MNSQHRLSDDTTPTLNTEDTFTLVSSGETFHVGDGFEAQAFRNAHFAGNMDPLVMVDHYWMSKPTFGAHPHAGMSAVSVIFEDSEGLFHNRDSLGNDFDIKPGDLYWLKAGSGAIHDESPRAGANIHGLQIFVNLPNALRNSTPASLHVKAQDMPILEAAGFRVRVVLGESNGIRGHQSPALPLTILDGQMAANSAFSHQLNKGENTWIHAIKGTTKIVAKGKQVDLVAGQAVAIPQLAAEASADIQLFNEGSEKAHFALFAGQPTQEPYVQKGPFIMATNGDVAQAEADFAAGKFGQLV